MRVTIVVPTYNEAENLPKLAAALFALPVPDFSLLVVDDNSPDGTGAVADRLVAEYPGCMSVIHRQGKLGLGTAYIRGFQQALAAGAEAVGQMDADFSHPVEKVPELIAAMDSCDVAMGSRYVTGGRLDERWPLWRKGLSTFANFYARTILRMPVRDVTGGFRIWSRETILAMPLERIKSSGYAFQVETIYISYRLGFRLKEVPIYFADRRWGQSKMSLQIQIEAAILVWQILFAYRHLQRQV